MKVRFRGVENCKKRVPLHPDTFDQVLKQIPIFKYHSSNTNDESQGPHQLPWVCGEFRMEKREKCTKDTRRYLAPVAKGSTIHPVNSMVYAKK